MPHSLRAKIKGLRYKGIITDKDCDRLCKALDNENVLDQIRAEIEQYQADCNLTNSDEIDCKFCDSITFDTIYRIIDKYRNEVSHEMS